MRGPTYTPGMLASALRLLEAAPTWVRGHRKRDGAPFVQFPAKTGRGAKSGRVYYATPDFCTCDGFNIHHNGVCSHYLAVRMEAERHKPRGHAAIVSDGTERLADAF